MTGATQIVTGTNGPAQQIPLIALTDCPIASDELTQEFQAAARAMLWTVAERRPGLFVPGAYLAAGRGRHPNPRPFLMQVVQWLAGDHDIAVVAPWTFRHHRPIAEIVEQVIAEAANQSGVRLIRARSVDLDDPLPDLVARMCEQTQIPPEHPMVLLAMWPADPAWDRAVHDLAGVVSSGRSGPVSVEFTGPGRPNPHALAAYRRYSPVKKSYGVVPIALPSDRQHLWTLNADKGGARVTPSVGHLLPEILLDRYDEAVRDLSH